MHPAHAHPEVAATGYLNALLPLPSWIRFLIPEPVICELGLQSLPPEVAARMNGDPEKSPHSAWLRQVLGERTGSSVC